MEVLKQPQFTPWAMEEQAVILYAAVNGCLMDVPTDKVAAFIREFTEHLNTGHWELLEAIGKTGELTPEQEQELSGAVEEFKQFYRTQI
jgi:F-type H+-transporting ATPase subunit alpha